MHRDQTNLDQADDDERSTDRPSGDIDVSVLIVGYNSKDLMMDCLEGLFEHTAGPSFEVLYTDCSNDGSMQAVRGRYPAVRVIDNDQNLGFGRGNNFLARHAKGRYLLLLNPDTLVKDNAIGALFDFAQKTPDAGAWGGVTRLPDGSVDPSCQQAGIGLGSMLMMLVGLGSFACPDVTRADGDGMDVPSLSGAYMMMPRGLWEQLGGFDETFFMYCEETDLCHRIHQAGYGVLITSSSSIVHLVGSGAAKSPKRMLALTRGGMHLTRKHFGPITVIIAALLRWLYSASRYFLGLLGSPLIGSDRAQQLRTRHQPIVFKPGDWFGGWNSKTTPSGNSKTDTPLEASTPSPEATTP